MIRKILSTVKSHGIEDSFRKVYHRMSPQKIKTFSLFKSHYKEKTGLEIGGPSNYFSSNGLVPVYPIATMIDNCNFGDQTVWEGNISAGRHFVFNKDREPGKQYIAEASNLHFIEDSTYDFVLSSHCIEHLANPLRGITEWVRVLKSGGILTLIIPHKDGTFDHRRPVTSLEHLLLDFENNTTEHDLSHLEEVLKYHDLRKDSGAGDFESFRVRSINNYQNRCLHHHVFNTQLSIQMMHHMQLQILGVEVFRPYNIVIIAKKNEPDQIIDNSMFTGINHYWSSPFPSDQEVSN